ncbi:hypothetical protein ACKKBG_A24230 [Auxenochlorella protothecoides x Auxenochlorella symbiontica]
MHACIMVSLTPATGNMRASTWTAVGLLTLCMCVHGRDSTSFRRRNLQASETATAIATAVASGDTAAAAEAIATALAQGDSNSVAEATAIAIADGNANALAVAAAEAVTSGGASADATAQALGEGSGAEIPPAQITDSNAIVAALQGKAQSSPSMTINPSAPDVTELKESIAPALAMAVADVCGGASPQAQAEAVADAVAMATSRVYADKLSTSSGSGARTCASPPMTPVDVAKPIAEASATAIGSATCCADGAQAIADTTASSIEESVATALAPSAALECNPDGESPATIANGAATAAATSTAIALASAFAKLQECSGAASPSSVLASGPSSTSETPFATPTSELEAPSATPASELEAPSGPPAAIIGSPDNEGDADPSINAPEIQPRKCNFVTIRNCCTDAAPETCQNGQYFKASPDPLSYGIKDARAGVFIQQTICLC